MCLTYLYIHYTSKYGLVPCRFFQRSVNKMLSTYLCPALFQRDFRHLTKTHRESEWYKWKVGVKEKQGRAIEWNWE